MKPVNIGLLGLGVVGMGTLKVLERNNNEIKRRAASDITVKTIAVRNLDRARDGDTSRVVLTDDPYQVINDPQIEVVVELIGGTTLARDYVLAALENGKHVVTANKALIALHGNEIFALAQSKGLNVAFESAVAGGIPVIKSIREGLAANRIESLMAIINGTSNYILTEMADKGSQFDDVLKNAQELGYAEADPSFDIGGIDAAHKLTILSSIAFGVPLNFDQVYVEGITQIASEDVDNACELGYVIKHVGVAKRVESGIENRVHPTLLPKASLMGNVNGVMNAILVKGDAVGETLYYGPGAGSEPTASSVVADIVDVVRTITSDPMNRVPHLAFHADAIEASGILKIDAVESAYYVRLTVKHMAGVLAKIATVMSENNISMRTIQQKMVAGQDSKASIVIMTEMTQEASLNQAIATIESFDEVTDNVARIRVIDA